jgi:hypothetical protein
VSRLDSEIIEKYLAAQTASTNSKVKTRVVWKDQSDFLIELHKRWNDGNVINMV